MSLEKRVEYSRSDSVLRQYLRDISHIPVLTHAEEIALGKRKERGDTAAYDEFVERNLRLVVHLAARFQHHGVSLLDLIQEGNVGLMTAVEKYDWRRGYRFATYGAWWIKQPMRRAISNQSREVRLPTHACRAISRLNEDKKQFFLTHGYNPSDEELGRYRGITADEVREIHSHDHRYVSLSAPVPGHEDTSIVDTLEDEQQGTPESELAIKEDQMAFAEAFAALSPGEQFVLGRRFEIGNLDHETLKQIGRKIKRSRQRIQQIESQAKGRLKKLILSRR